MTVGEGGALVELVLLQTKLRLLAEHQVLRVLHHHERYELVQAL